MLSTGEVHTSQWIRSKACAACEEEEEEEEEEGS
jgi:hypothetical protein